MQKQVRRMGRSNSSTRSGHRSFVTGCASNAIGPIYRPDRETCWWSWMGQLLHEPGRSASPSAAVKMRCTSEPSARMTYVEMFVNEPLAWIVCRCSGDASESLAKAIHDPSGDHTGNESNPDQLVNCCSFEPSASIT